MFWREFLAPKMISNIDTRLQVLFGHLQKRKMKKFFLAHMLTNYIW
jgi:hypothetical protein